MRVLIVGAGIAGPTLAHWLLRAHHEVSIVERAPAPREGGYIVDFWGAGFEVAERMGLSQGILDRSYSVQEVREVDDTGRVLASIDPRPAFTTTKGRFVSIPRSELAATILDSVRSRAELIFDDTVDAIDDQGDAVTVTFESGSVRDFDLVVGADGQHSRVRELVFGPESQFERYLGIVFAVAVLDDYTPRDELVAVTHTTVGAQALRFAQRDGSTMIAFTFRADENAPVEGAEAQLQLLHTTLGNIGWEVPAMLEQLPNARSFYCDRASQVLMPTWNRGRTALVGDAAACASLLAGQGSALAMVESYYLANELNRSSTDTRSALESYEQALAPFIRRKQDAATRMGVAFAPRNRLQLALRNTAMRAMSMPWLARKLIGAELRDGIELPDPVAL